eukprot:TRINITY_DN333_c0_g2_i1.p1 TRINITY_DN333_c0_g2~~TRINITY_DN333_c0_g2_i1.p1  ORF type:complete len:511 (-),score=153.78 TRINITY_DN333_c0_g2_i1:72-1604(-)
MVYFVLYESASGFALFERSESEEIADQSPEFQESVTDFKRFSRIVHLKAFVPFTSSENALENINDVAEGILNPFLKNFLEQNLPKVKDGKSSKHVLGVGEDKIGSSVQDAFNIRVERTTTSLELLRGIRHHFPVFLKSFAGEDVKVSDLVTAQRGLAHSYSRAKVKFNVNKADNMIIQSISLLDQLDKDINTFAMRVREWYSWHFPELVKIVNDNILFARVVHLLKGRENASEDLLDSLEAIIGDQEKAKQVLQAARVSMGTDISEVDMLSIIHFAERVIKLAEYRQGLQSYLHKRMNDIAPNLSALIGETVGARLINHAGSLVNLAKFPASTVQILGAEKALFRALKTRGNTPKYGLIFNSTWIGKAKPKDKGRISRYLANKCSIASRIDSFTDKPTPVFGELLREQMEDRLHFYETGEAPKKNVDVMKKAIEKVGADLDIVDDDVEKKKIKKRKSDSGDKMEVDEESPKKHKSDETPKKDKKDKKSKKDKKDKKDKKEKKKKQDSDSE